MTFVEELLKAEKEKVVPEQPKTQTKEEIEHQKRHEYIMSGQFGKEIVDSLKKELMRSVQISQMTRTTMERCRTQRCIYEEKEYRKKEHEFLNHYYHAAEVKEDQKTRRQAYIDYYVPHCVFDNDEIEHLKCQLQKILVNEGFGVTFDIQEFKYKVCNGLAINLKKKTYGKTMSFTVHW